MSDHHIVDSLETLEALYGEVNPTSLSKELDRLSEPYKAYVRAAPLVILATVGPEGVDCSPRGDPAGFVHILNDKTIALPDRRGNNRLDSLKNIVRDNRVSLLFLIPGIGNTLRINGRGRISVEPDLRASFTMSEKIPTSVLVIDIDSVYFQCKKALARSDFWNPETQSKPEDLPSAGEMLRSALNGDFDAETYDSEYPERMKKTIY